MIKFIPHKYFVKYLILIGLFMMINYNKSYAAQQLPKRGELTIVAWWGIPRNELTLNRFIELKAAGFNVTFNNMATLDDLKRALFLGRLSGVKIIATNRDIVNADLNSIRQIRDSTSLLAYSLGDEPNASQFNELKSKVVQIKNADKNHPCYINLLPDASREMLGTDFPNYLHRAIFELQLSFLSFDIYPITTKGINGGWYDNLEKAAEAARNSNIPMWTFVLSTPHSTPGTTYATPSINSLRLQVYSNLAYGSQAIQYFTYWLPESKEYNYHDAPITAGKKTKTYNLVKKMNQEIQAISGVFKDGYVEDVAHIGVQPKGTRMLMRQPDGMEITKRTSGSHLLISQIRHKDAKYVVLQNC
ncbi:MAG: hypothetical protein LIR46_09785, partial [Bacteroidota bacterium]|nr:hypothetical protein [Bacteroidota bacterium]